VIRRKPLTVHETARALTQHDYWKALVSGPHTVRGPVLCSRPISNDGATCFSPTLAVNLDGSNKKTSLFVQGTLSGIAYAEVPVAA
jgi:hypothetical protein